MKMLSDGGSTPPASTKKAGLLRFKFTVNQPFSCFSGRKNVVGLAE